jgi:phage FluMu protein Com
VITKSQTAPDWPCWDGFDGSGQEFVRIHPQYAKAWRFAQLLDERLCSQEVERVAMSPMIAEELGRMACKLKCPKCKRVLKERGDRVKSAQGTYTVLEGEPRLIRCNKCKAEDTVVSFDQP